MLKRILVLLPNLRICNGVSSYVMNYFRNMDHNEIKMDFAVLKDIPSPYVDEIKQHGGEVFVMPSPKKIFAYCAKIKQIYTIGKYDVVHSNVVNASIPYLYLAKKMGIQNRILHSHATRTAEIRWKEIRNNVLSAIALKYSSHFFACSRAAGDSLFGSRQYIVVNNAIQLEKFKFNEQKRKLLRKKMELENKFVIGSVGRPSYQKNPFFALDVLKETVNRDKDIVYLWIGSGPLDNEVKEYAHKIGIQEYVKFLGNRDDVADLYHVMDVFFLPSLYEGLPVVGIEAQANSLPLVCADTITKELDISNNVCYLSLADSKSKWAEQLLMNKNKRPCVDWSTIQNSGYDIVTESTKMQKIYQNL